MEGGLVHFLVRVIGAQVTGAARIRIPGLPQRESMRCMTTVASLLHQVAAFTEAGTDLLGNGRVFSLDAHPLKTDGMAALSELLDLCLVTFPTFVRKDEGLLLGSRLVVDVTGDTVDPSLRVLRFRPRLEKAGRPFLMTGDAKAYVDLLVGFSWRTCTGDQRSAQDGQGKEE